MTAIIRNRQRLSSADDLKRSITEYKRREGKPLTNYVPDPLLHGKWAESGKAEVYTFESGVFFVHDKEFMLETVFISNVREDIMDCLASIRNDSGKPVVVERVFREGKDEQIGTPDCILRRMSRTNISGDPGEPSKRVEKATAEDMSAIKDIFSQYFNPFTERIPDNEELRRLIEMGGISVVRGDDGLTGMVVYEKNSANIHLRYWWVSPLHRNRGIGADLLRDYFCAGRECKRQFLWVFSDNEDAIDKYRHYGFEFDGIADEIYVIK